jgi:multimeric flavodoxin WrbA
MRILAVSSSPRAGGNTDMILHEALTSARAEGAVVELVRISDYRLEPCNGCRSCFSAGKCVVEDDDETLYRIIAKADGVILGSPSYFQGVTAQMKIFIDRIGYLALARGRKDFAEKVGGVIAVARRSGVANTCSQMITFLTAVGMIIPSGGRVFAIGREKGEVLKDQEGIDTARHLGKMMAQTAVALARAKAK